MKGFFSKFGWISIEILSGCFALTLFFSLFNNADLIQSEAIQGLDVSVVTQNAAADYVIPEVDETMFVVDNGILPLNSVFDWKQYVHVRDSVGNDLIDYVVARGTPDTSKFGEFEMIYELNWNGTKIQKSAIYYVNE